MNKNINGLTVPNLMTASIGPELWLENLFLERQVEIESWLRARWLKNPPPITSSVDLRNAGFKLAPVDTNLFPAGFNNLNRDLLPLAIQAAQSIVVNYMSGCLKIMLIPENHTRNKFYFESIATLQEIFVKAGFQVEIGSLLPDLSEPLTIDLDDDRSITLKPIEREGNEVKIGDFKPCLILLNNDLSGGVPEILKGLSQQIRPSQQLGWNSRLKSDHFSFYKTIAEEFARDFNFDPWIISPLFRVVDNVDFMNGNGIEQVAAQVDEILLQVKLKYQEHNITEAPFVAIKSDAGTYGMGVMMVKDSSQITSLNRKQRTKMSASKGSNKINRVIIQEGVPSFEMWNDEDYSEPVVYMLGQYVIGGFYRVHKGKSKDENLNAPGMHFEPLAFASACNNPDKIHQKHHSNRFYAYGVISRLAGLAAAYEIKSLETL